MLNGGAGLYAMCFYLFQLPELFLPFAWLYLLALQPSTKGPSLLGFSLDFIVFLPTQAGHPLTSSQFLGTRVAIPDLTLTRTLSQKTQRSLCKGTAWSF